MSNALTALILWVSLVTGTSVISSFPSSYLFEFTGSQIAGCRVEVNNPLIRTGLGLVGTAGGGVGWWGGALAKATELSIPKTAEVFHSEVCK